METTARRGKEWLVEMDALKAAAIVLIVLSHLHFYLSYPDALNALEPYAGEFGTCLFIFASGYTLYINNRNIRSIGDIAAFYKKRVARIVPLYWVAILVFALFFGYLHFYAMDQANADYSPAGIAINLLGLQAILGHEVPTMWFISVILIYYLLYPLIVFFARRPGGILAASIAAILPLVLLRLAFATVHYYLFLYYFVFIAGILAASTGLLYDKRYEKYVPAFSLAMLSGLLAETRLFNGGVADFYGFSLMSLIATASFTAARDVLEISFSIVFFHLVRVLVPAMGPRLIRVLSAMALGAYATYLFHEIVLSIVRTTLDYLSIAGLYSDLLMVAAFPCVFIAGYLIQRSSGMIGNAVRPHGGPQESPAVKQPE